MRHTAGPRESRFWLCSPRTGCLCCIRADLLRQFTQKRSVLTDERREVVLRDARVNVLGAVVGRGRAAPRRAGCSWP